MALTYLNGVKTMGFLEDLAKTATSAAQGVTGAVGGVVDYLGTAANLPELGISEMLAGGQNTANTDRYDINTGQPLQLTSSPISGTTSTFYNLAKSTSPTTVSATQPTATSNIDGDVLGASDYNTWLANQQAAQAAQEAQQLATNKSNEVASYDDQISNLERLLGYAATKRQQGIQGIDEQYANTKALQEQAFEKQRLQNIQNQEKGYGEVGTFANTSINNLNRLLQGANAGRSSVGQILAPFMVNRSAETRRKAVTDTAGENLANIESTAGTTFQDLSNQRKKSLQDYEASVLGSQNELESQKRQAIINRGLASGQGYEQARAGASALDASMNDRYTQLADLFSKYKPDYSVKEAPALSTYQVDPAKINAQSQSTNDYYLNMLKRKKELNQGV